MSNIINEELIELASEFAAVRQGSKKNWFPKELWLKAVAIAQKNSLPDVCRAIKVHPAYFRKKMLLLAPLNSDESMTFVEIASPTQKIPGIITINIETFDGYKLMINDMPTSCLTTILSEFLKERSSCCK